jgi:hypothetical protein
MFKVVGNTDQTGFVRIKRILRIKTKGQEDGLAGGTLIFNSHY